MDFSNRGTQHAAGPGTQAPIGSPVSKHSKNNSKDLWSRVGVVVAIACVVVLLLGIVLALYGSNNDNKDTESKYIYSNKLQAVFLNTGQVYFGNISVLNNNFLVLNHIFYLQTNSSSSSTTTTSSSNNVSLVKLGCELHMPYDQMIINRAQVTFWENLQSGGQVSKAVATWEKQHPNGQSCTDQSSSSGSTTSTVQPSSSDTDK